jgi:hypothetical protein
MRTIKFYVSALLIAGVLFSTPSCVDDKESSSVTAMREAYADQLKAQGALAQSQAESEKIKLEAEIALLKAQEKQAIAKAKLDEANALLIAAQTDIEKQKAEQQKALAAQELKRLQAQIELEMAEAKVKLEQLQISAEIEMLNLQKELDKAKNQKDEVLEEAINAYKLLAFEINSLKNNIASGELELTYNKSVLDNMKAQTEANTAESIKTYNTWIANAESSIASNKLALEGWKLLVKDIDFAKIEAEITAKTKEYQALLVKRTSVYKEYNTQREVFEKGAKKDLKDFQELVGKGYTSRPFPYDRTFYTLTEVNSNIASTIKNLESTEASLKQYKNDLAVATSKTEALLKVKNEKEVIKDKAYEAYQTAQQVYWNNPTSENWTKMDKAGDAYYAANSVYNTAENEYSNNVWQISNLNSSISNYADNIVSYKERLARQNEQKEAFGGDVDKADKLTKAYLEAEKVFMVASDAYEKLNEEIRVMGDYIAELNKIYYSAELHGTKWQTGITSDSISYIKSIIAGLENDIAQKESNIVRWKRDITNSTELNKKALAELDLNITTLDADIKRMKFDLQVAEKQAAAAKKVIEERMK